MCDEPILPGGIDWEQVQQEEALWPWINDPSHELYDEWSDFHHGEE